MAIMMIRLLAVIVLVASCSRAAVPYERIYDGQPALPGQFGFQAAIQHNWYFCTGTLISPSAVLTSASCLAYSNANLNMTIGAADFANANAEGAEIRYAGRHQVLTHDNLALIQIDPPIKKSEFLPVRLPARSMDEHFENRTRVTIMGWDQTYTGSPADDKLYYAETFTYNFVDCLKFYGAVNLDKTQLCLDRSFTYMPTPCYHDYGGPMLVQNESGEYTIIGVHSHKDPDVNNIGCFESTIPIIYSRVTAFLDWIEANVPDVIIDP